MESFAFDTAPRSLNVRNVRKRDGKTKQPFDIRKIENAIRKAWASVDSAAVNDNIVTEIAQFTLNSLPDGDVTDVERIQDTVEIALMKYNMREVAIRYMEYRDNRTQKREKRLVPDKDAASNYVHFAKYAKFRPEWRRREVYHETVDRVEDMHLRRYAHLPEFQDKIRWAFNKVRNKEILPSMRSMQFAGKAIEVNNNRIYNCSFSLVDRVEVFAEAMFLLLSGCGTGYSVQFDHVEQLPELARINMKDVRHHVIQDSIEGWADAVQTLMDSYVNGYYVEFSYHLIRPEGTPLKTSGGKAPGHMRLKQSLDLVRGILHGAQGRQLRPLECHDIMCLLADAVLSGGIRRSAMISLFSADDSEMMFAKTGDWSKHPWRKNANNSAVLKRGKVEKKIFKRIIKMARDWGEPGFLFVSDEDYGTNPCAEIGLDPRYLLTEEIIERIRAWNPQRAINLFPGNKATGWAFCNLCEINASKLTSLQDFMDAAHAATIIGTVQASYTSMPYLGPISEAIAERDALLGIGMTGIMDRPDIALNDEFQRQVARNVRDWNAGYAATIGIRPAARTTCVKPSGTTTLEVNCSGSGCHPAHARRYIRRITANENETVFKAFHAANPTMCVRQPNGDWSIEFPMQAPAGAVVKDDLGAVEFLKMVKKIQENWVVPGTADDTISPGLRHNVSNTVHCKPHEWHEVGEFLWENQDSFTGVSVFSYVGDKAYPFAPNEAVTTESDEVRWNQLVADYTPVDYLQIFEDEDSTALGAEAACAGGACEVVFSK